tara:strand:+ start:2288 stop:3298 length:1011 start_codon:yes stop_codon:yes gene_type:complete
VTVLLSLREVSKTYGSSNLPAVDGISFECQGGEITAIIGGSGSGKSTLLRIIAGLEIPDSGHIVLNGIALNGFSQFVPPEKRDCTLVPQDYALFPNMTIRQNVFFGKRAQDKPTRIRELLELTRIEKLEHRYPHQISGGEQQRVALVRALATNPSLLLLDEPLSNLDQELRDSVRTELIDLFRKTETTALFVSHDTDDAITMADKVIVLRDGKAVQIGTPTVVYNQPTNSYIALLFGKTNLIPLEIFPKARYNFADSESGLQVVSVRPHELKLVNKDTSQCSPHFSGKVLSIQSKGNSQEVILDTKELTLTASFPISHRIHVGDLLTVAVEENQSM